MRKTNPKSARFVCGSSHDILMVVVHDHNALDVSGISNIFVPT